MLGVHHAGMQVIALGKNIGPPFPCGGFVGIDPLDPEKRYRLTKAGTFSPAHGDWTARVEWQDGRYVRIFTGRNAPAGVEPVLLWLDEKESRREAQSCRERAIRNDLEADALDEVLTRLLGVTVDSKLVSPLHEMNRKEGHFIKEFK
jgi:hypothetical protein